MMPLTEVLLPLLCLPRRPGRIDDRFAALHCGVHTHVRKGLHGVNNRNVVYCAGHYMRALHQSVYCDAGSRFCVSAATCTAHISHISVNSSADCYGSNRTQFVKGIVAPLSSSSDVSIQNTACPTEQCVTHHTAISTDSTRKDWLGVIYLFTVKSLAAAIRALLTLAL
eukprot:19151-Heterococcus_DN1.PRE.2